MCFQNRGFCLKNPKKYTTGTLGVAQKTDTYTYGNTSWGDQLTAYKGNSITYDAIGNPTQIATGAGGGYNLTWQGRRLLNYTGYGTENGTSLSFTYNDDELFKLW